MKCNNYIIQSITLSIFLFVPTVFAESSDNLRFSLLGGITFGGDAVGYLQYLDGSKEYVYSGDFAYFGAGLEYSINQDFTLQLNAQYHWDEVAAVNAEIRFSRYEFEIIPYYQLSERYRIGLGLGIHTNVKLSGDFDVDTEFDNANAVIASVSRKMKYSDHWLEFRVVNIEYLMTKYNDNRAFYNLAIPFDGDHVGFSYHMLF